MHPGFIFVGVFDVTQSQWSIKVESLSAIELDEAGKKRCRWSNLRKRFNGLKYIFCEKCDCQSRVRAFAVLLVLNYAPS